MPHSNNLFIFILTLLFYACHAGNTVGLKSDEIIQTDSENSFRIWVLSDIQPRNSGERDAFKNAVFDINLNVPGLDMAIVGGDIVDITEEEMYEWYISTRELSYIKDWNEIAGNHDLKNDLGKLYREKVNKNFNYSVVRDNVLFIFMSDEVKSKATEISDETFNWWKDLVINNQDKIIVVVTHAPLEGSGIPFSSLRARQILDSERFREVLKNYKVDLWISGHLHLPHALTNNLVKKAKLNGTIFLNISSIRPEFFNLKKSESRVITFSCDSDEVLIQSRNHDDKSFDDSLSYVFKLSKKFICDGDLTEV